jgi:L-alanine-DL-glutamate epimerase-like enolase superfamily enzyme
MEGSQHSDMSSTVPTPIAAAGPARGKVTDVRVTRAELYLLPVETRIPLKFGTETLTSVTCARVRLTVRDRKGRTAVGWGETPLSVQWVWPSEISYAVRHTALEHFCRQLVSAWVEAELIGHPIEVGTAFLQRHLPKLRARFNERVPGGEGMPHLAALVCCSPFDIALHDAFGNLVSQPIYQTYNGQYMNHDLATLLGDSQIGHSAATNGAPTLASNQDFKGKYPSDFLREQRLTTLPVWHLVGGLDPLDDSELTGNEPQDGEPLVLQDWIQRDGLKCLKIKLRGNNSQWDYQRLVRVGRIAIQNNVEHLTTDFNCTVHDPAYVQQVLDRLQREERAIYDRVLYVEQPFPYDLQAHPIDVHELAARKPLLMDESADSWEQVRLGQSLGWNGVALKTCKTQSGALLSLCWARAHGMHLMVQDLTNPMLAQIPHVQLAAHAHTMVGVESNAMQFYPEASRAESEVHPGIYARRQGVLDLTSITGPGFGYRIDEIQRELPPQAAHAPR